MRLRPNEKLSNAFEELNHYSYIKNGCTSTFKWSHLYNPQDETKPEVLLKIYSIPEEVFIFLEEVEAHKLLKKDFEASKLVLEFQSPIIKYAISKDQQSAEVLQAYCGYPIANIYERLNNNNLIIQVMEKLLRDCAGTLLKTKMFHGNISPDNINIDFDRSVLRFQGGHSARFLDPDKSDYILKFKSIYYSLSDFSKPLSASNARTADIKALALSIYEIGFVKHPFSIIDSAFTKNVKGVKVIDLDKLLTASNHVSNIKKTLAQKLNNLLVFILRTTSDITYEKILEQYNSEIYPSFQASKKYKMDIREFPFETKIDYDPKLITIRKYNYCVYKIEDLTGTKQPYIIKKYKNIAARNYEIDIFKKIEEAKLLSFAKRKMDYLPQFDQNYKIPELLIEFCGLTFPERLLYNLNDNTIIKKILSAIANVMGDLLNLQMFNCNIQPYKLLMSDDWRVKLFDYDISVIDFEPNPKGKSLDGMYTFIILGGVLHSAAPEMLQCYLGDSKKVTLNPFKADLYSLGKTVICTITHNFTNLETLNNLYDLNCPTDEEKAQYIRAKLTPEDITKCEKTAIFPDLNDKLMAYFYIKYNNVFVDNVIKYSYTKAHTGCKFEEYKDIMKFLATLVATNPNERPDIEKLRAYSFSDFSPCSPFKLDDLVSNHVINQPMANKGYDITYLLKQNSKLSEECEWPIKVDSMVIANRLLIKLLNKTDQIGIADPDDRNPDLYVKIGIIKEKGINIEGYEKGMVVLFTGSVSNVMMFDGDKNIYYFCEEKDIMGKLDGQ